MKSPRRRLVAGIVWTIACLTTASLTPYYSAALGFRAAKCPDGATYATPAGNKGNPKVVGDHVEFVADCPGGPALVSAPLTSFPHPAGPRWPGVILTLLLWNVPLAVALGLRALLRRTVFPRFTST